MNKYIFFSGALAVCLLLSSCAVQKSESSIPSEVSSASESSSSEPSSIPDDSDSSETESSESESSHLKLHDSDLEPPSEEVCQAAQSRIFADMSEEDIQLVKDTIHFWHMSIEGEFVNYNARELLQSPDSPAWQLWEDQTAAVQMPGDDGYLVTSYDVNTVISDLQKLVDVVQNEDFLSDLQSIQATIQTAVDQHSIDEMDHFHQLLHDCDYWLVNYGDTLEIAPPDWDGVNIYFDCLESLRYN